MNNQHDNRFRELLIEVNDNSGIHESLDKLFPIVLVSENIMNLYDVKRDNTYEFIQADNKPQYIPDKILAAFPYEKYDNKVAAVVHKGALGSLEGRIFVQHEFVHCYQYEKCEMKLKEQLDIFRVAMAEQNYMWEIMHSFPYDNEEIKKNLVLLSEFNYELAETPNVVLDELRKIKKLLDKHDYEYMIWQIWKEGFARYIENILREKSDIKYNYYSYKTQIDRTVFYQIGDRYFRTFNSANSIDIEQSFNQLFHLK